MTEWPTTNLADQTSFVYLNGLWKGKKPPFQKAVVIRNTNFRNDGILDLDDVAVLDVEARQLESRQLQLGDIIIERSGGGPKQPVGRVCYFNVRDSRPHSFSNFTTTLRVKDTNSFLPRFVHYYLLHLYNSGFTVPLQRATTGIRNLDFNAYQQAEIPIPPKKEQEKIVAVLWKLQRAIETEEKIIATAHELKKSAMRQLFACGLRGEPRKESQIGLIPESWNPKRLDDCCSVVSSSVSYTDFAEMPETPDSDSVSAMGIKVSDMNLVGNEFQIVRANLQKRVTTKFAEKKLVPSNTVVFPKRGAAIATNKKRMTTAWTVLDPNLIGVKAGEGVNSGFLFYWFQKFDLRTITEPGPTPQLNKKNLTPLLLPIPNDSHEQADIAGILQTIDSKLSVHKSKRKTLQELFKTILNQLMTGEIRAADLVIDLSEIKS
jgi:type I restriction enzyme S subunit